jgi:hypothetical protein
MIWLMAMVGHSVCSRPVYKTYIFGTALDDSYFWFHTRLGFHMLPGSGLAMLVNCIFSNLILVCSDDQFVR